jgi:hypothetical protein
MPTVQILEGHRFIEALVKGKVIPENSTKVIIEADAKGLVLIHYTSVGTENLLGVLSAAVEEARVGDAT